MADSLGSHAFQQAAVDRTGEARAAIDKPGVGLQQRRTGSQHLPSVIGVEDASDANDRQLPLDSTIKSSNHFARAVLQWATRKTACTDGFDLVGRSHQSVSRDRRVGGDQSCESAGECQVGDVIQLGFRDIRGDFE